MGLFSRRRPDDDLTTDDADVEPDGAIPDVGSVAVLLEKVGTDGVVRRDDLTLELGNTGFQRLFLGRLRERHARQDAGHKQGSRQRMAHQRCSTVSHEPSPQ